MSGLHQSLISVFSEYILRNEKDIQDLITLINDVPRYTNDVLEYTKKQADKNTLQFDYDSVTQDIQDVINNKENSSITSALYNAIDSLNLDEEKTTSYKAQVKDAMDTSFFPSYQAMLDTLTSLQYNVHYHKQNNLQTPQLTWVFLEKPGPDIFVIVVLKMS